MLTFYLCTFLYLFNSLEISVSEKPEPPIVQDKFKVLFIEPNSVYHFKSSKLGFFEKNLNTYCYSGKNKTLGRLLETIELSLDIEGDDYTQYDGTTPEDVEEHYNEHRSLFSFSLFSQKSGRLSLSPFVQQCIGIESVKPYTVRLIQNKMDYMRLGILMSGIVIFLFAGQLSTNSIFYYATGIVFGIFSSFLVVIWLSGKLMPKKTLMYGVVVGGWTVGLYVIRMLWNNLQVIMMTYRNYVCWYIIVMGIISFFLCYRWGPPNNRRSRNIIKWLLQLMSLALIYISSNFKEAVVAIIAMTVILYHSRKVLFRAMHLKSKTATKPPQSSAENTMRRELRTDCRQWGFNSPQRNEWKVNKVSSRLSVNNSISSRSKQNVSIPTNGYADEQISESDVSANENNEPKGKLYPLPDGSFVLSEKPPIIFTPQQIDVPLMPIYHRSTPTMASDDSTFVESAHTPLSHLCLPLAATHARHLSTSSLTSDLCIMKKGRRSFQSPSEFQRSSSAQRGQTRASRLVASAKKKVIHSSYPKINIEKSATDESE